MSLLHWKFNTKLLCAFIVTFLCAGTLILNNRGSRQPSIASTMTEELFLSDFEVFGEVQGVFFRKYTKIRAVELKLSGWCMNTAAGTVKGQMQGNTKQIQEMQHWLQNVGSPSSKIERTIFSAPRKLDSPSFSDFKIKH